MNNYIEKIILKLKNEFNDHQIYTIRKILFSELENKDITNVVSFKPLNNDDALNHFISAKKIEGCSDRTLNYYKNIILLLFNNVHNEYYNITTEELRTFLSNYCDRSRSSRATVDNIRRVISSFFSWLEDEDYITKSPVRRIHKVKAGKKIKETYSDEFIELLRQNVKNIRDLAIIDMLYSTGIRVGELVGLKIDDIDFNNRECIVLGKGNKQRKVYFDAKTKIHLSQYLESRVDNNNNLFVSLLSPYDKLEVSGVEIVLRKLGKSMGNIRVHPHKFRRTLATKAIDKGMPIEQVQHLLGHSKIETTLDYALVDENNVKLSHKKYLN